VGNVQVVARPSESGATYPLDTPAAVEVLPASGPRLRLFDGYSRGELAPVARRIREALRIDGSDAEGSYEDDDASDVEPVPPDPA
jgi:hypothetical protein